MNELKRLFFGDFFFVLLGSGVNTIGKEEKDCVFFLLYLS